MQDQNGLLSSWRHQPGLCCVVQPSPIQSLLWSPLQVWSQGLALGHVLRIKPETDPLPEKKCKIDPAGSGSRGRDSSQVTLLLTVKADDLKEVSSLPQVKSGKHSHFGWSRKHLASFCFFCGDTVGKEGRVEGNRVLGRAGETSRLPSLDSCPVWWSASWEGRANGSQLATQVIKCVFSSVDAEKTWVVRMDKWASAV